MRRRKPDNAPIVAIAIGHLRPETELSPIRTSGQLSGDVRDDAEVAVMVQQRQAVQFGGRRQDQIHRADAAERAL